MSKTIAKPAATATPTPAVASKMFTPPLFGNFGKKAKDLFKKKYDYENSARIVNATLDGTVVETQIVSTDSGLRGVLKSSLPVPNLGALSGVFDTEYHTVANKESKTAYRLTNLYPGLGVKLNWSAVQNDVKTEPEFIEGYVSAEAEYQTRFFQGSLNVRTDTQRTYADVSAAVGFDRLAVGGKATLDAAKAANAQPVEVNFGAEFNGTGYTLSAVTEKKRTLLTLSYFQPLSKKASFGLQSQFGLIKPTRAVQFGAEGQLDPDTSVKSFVRVDSGKDSAVLAVAGEQRLVSPNMAYGVAAEFNVNSAFNLQATKFGINATLGDF